MYVDEVSYIGIINCKIIYFEVKINILIISLGML